MICVYIRTMYTDVYTFTDIQTWGDLCLCTYVCIYIYTYMYTYIHIYSMMYIYIHTMSKHIPTYVSRMIHAYIDTYIHTYIHTHTHTHIYIYTYIHIYIYTHKYAVCTHAHTYTYMGICMQGEDDGDDLFGGGFFGASHSRRRRVDLFGDATASNGAQNGQISNNNSDSLFGAQDDGDLFGGAGLLGGPSLLFAGTSCGVLCVCEYVCVFGVLRVFEYVCVFVCIMGTLFQMEECMLRWSNQHRPCCCKHAHA
jgi:hypothetical protein